MKVILYNAVSEDGFIATLEGDSDWVNDDEEFEAFVIKTGCILIGRKTYEQFRGEIYPIAGIVNFVYSHNPENLKDEATKELQFVSGSPKDVIKKIKEQGFKSIMLGGGSETNASFVAAGLIDEMILDVHLIKLKSGKKLLGSYTKKLPLTLISTKKYPNFMQLRYKVGS